MAELLVIGYDDVETTNSWAPSAAGALKQTAGAALGGFWGLLFGLIFLVPVGGLIIGGIMGGLHARPGHERARPARWQGPALLAQRGCREGDPGAPRRQKQAEAQEAPTEG